MTFTIETIYHTDRYHQEKVDALLQKEGIRRDNNLEYTCGVYNEDGALIGTGSCYKNTLRCLAVDSDYRGMAIMNLIVQQLNQHLLEQGYSHLYVYTKYDCRRLFQDLGFYPIAFIEGSVAFLENRKNGFLNYLEQIKTESPVTHKTQAAIVMNANPFTLGHLALVERACKENDLVHLFIVSDDASLFSYAIRQQLIKEATKVFDNIVYHETGDYLISTKTFPSYFQKDEASVSTSHAALDATIFCKIAKVVGITKRYVGEEQTSQVTALYNEMLSEILPKNGIELIQIERKKTDADEIISASTVRQCIHDGKLAELSRFLPESTLQFLQSEDARPIIQKIVQQKDVIHH